jgi:hypothetical protein
MGTERRGHVGEAEDQEISHVAWPMSSSMPAGRRLGAVLSGGEAGWPGWRLEVGELGAGARLGAHARSGREGSSGGERELPGERGAGADARSAAVIPGRFRTFWRDSCFSVGHSCGIGTS